MSDSDGGSGKASEDLARWLQEVGKRRSSAPSKDDLLDHLEKVAGRKIETPQDITDYVNELTRRAQSRSRIQQRFKSIVLAALLLISLLQYYFIDVQLQILSQPSLTVFIPTKPIAQPGARI